MPGWPSIIGRTPYRGRVDETRELGPIAGAELGEDVRDVPLDGLRGQDERLCDLAIAGASGDQRGDLRSRGLRSRSRSLAGFRCPVARPGRRAPAVPSLRSAPCRRRRCARRGLQPRCMPQSAPARSRGARIAPTSRWTQTRSSSRPASSNASPRLSRAAAAARSSPSAAAIEAIARARQSRRMGYSGTGRASHAASSSFASTGRAMRASSSADTTATSPAQRGHPASCASVRPLRAPTRPPVVSTTTSASQPGPDQLMDCHPGVRVAVHSSVRSQRRQAARITDRQLDAMEGRRALPHRPAAIAEASLELDRLDGDLVRLCQSAEITEHARQPDACVDHRELAGRRDGRCPTPGGTWPRPRAPHRVVEARSRCGRRAATKDSSSRPRATSRIALVRRLTSSNRSSCMAAPIAASSAPRYVWRASTDDRSSPPAAATIDRRGGDRLVRGERSGWTCRGRPTARSLRAALRSVRSPPRERCRAAGHCPDTHGRPPPGQAGRPRARPPRRHPAAECVPFIGGEREASGDREVLITEHARQLPDRSYRAPSDRPGPSEGRRRSTQVAAALPRPIRRRWGDVKSRAARSPVGRPAADR